MSEVEQGVGDCPKRPDGLGHMWASWRVDPFRSCEFCGTHGREPALNFDGQGMKPNQGGGYFARVTAMRSDFFSGLKAPMENGTGKAPAAAPSGRAAEIVADKKRRDAEAVANGTARPGQIAGARRR